MCDDGEADDRGFGLKLLNLHVLGEAAGKLEVHLGIDGCTPRRAADHVGEH